MSKIAALSTATILSLGACDVAPDNDQASVEPENLVVAAESCSVPFSGEDVFRGVFFGEGPAALVIPKLTDHIDDELMTMLAAKSQDERIDPDLPLRGPDWDNDKLVALSNQASDKADGAEANGNFERAFEWRTLAEALAQGSERGGDGTDALRSLFVAHLSAVDPGFLERFGMEMQSGDPLRLQQAMQSAAEMVLGTTKALAELEDIDLNLTGKVDPGQECGVAVWFAAVVAVVVNVVAALNHVYLGDFDDGDPNPLWKAEYISNLTLGLAVDCD